MQNWHIHTGYIVLGCVLAFASWLGVHSWVAQHDWAVKAQMAVDSANVQVKTLNQQISTRDTLAHQQQQVIVKVIHDVQTPQAATKALPQVVPQLPVLVVEESDGGWLVPKADVVPIFQQLADDKLCQSKLNACTQDLSDTKTIVTARDTEIVSLKRPKGFWQRLGGTLKAVGIGVGIGIALGHHV